MKKEKNQFENILLYQDQNGDFWAIRVGEVLGQVAVSSIKNIMSHLQNLLDFTLDSDTIKSEENFDGGPGSGRYPKGSGKSKFSAGTYKKELIGITTSTGKKIRAIHSHALKRMQERDIYPSSVAAALKKGKVMPGNVDGRTVYEYKGTRVVVVDEINEIRTVIYRGKEK